MFCVRFVCGFFVTFSGDLFSADGAADRAVGSAAGGSGPSSKISFFKLFKIPKELFSGSSLIIIGYLSLKITKNEYNMSIYLSGSILRR
ncbi:hypothetical protein D3C86_1767300 [compost metagenome]